MREHTYYTYILASRRNGTLYVGVTNDIFARTIQHRDGTASQFTRKHGVTMLVWFEEHEDIEIAIAREKSIKRWRRSWMLELIERDNPEWRDLFEDML